MKIINLILLLLLTHLTLSAQQLVSPRPNVGDFQLSFNYPIWWIYVQYRSKKRTYT